MGFEWDFAFSDGTGLGFDSPSAIQKVSLGLTSSRRNSRGYLGGKQYKQQKHECFFQWWRELTCVIHDAGRVVVSEECRLDFKHKTRRL